MTVSNSLHIVGLSDQPRHYAHGDDVTSTYPKVFAHQSFGSLGGNDGLANFIVSGTLDEMRQYAETLHALAYLVNQQCEKLEGEMEDYAQRRSTARGSL